MKQRNQIKGFTIIEVVLVLAIAGLIFLMVFIAIPALQRNQRDTQRKDDVSRAMTAINNYSSNNRGRLPTSTTTTPTIANGNGDSFITDYLTVGGDAFNDPALDGNYAFQVRAATSAPPAFASTTTGSGSSERRVIYYTVGATCNGESLTTGQGNRKISLRIRLEGGGIACFSN